MTAPPAHVGIVGAGPRGLSVLERLCANARVAGPTAPITVHVVDPTSPGAGRVWRADQSTHLLMNTVSSQITAFTDDSVRIEGPIEPGPSLYDWAADVARGAGPAGLPDDVVAEARRTGPDTYPTRAFYGHYLGACFDEVVRRAPAHLRVVVHRSTAVALIDGEQPDGAQPGSEQPGGERAAGRQSLRLADGTQLDGLDAVVLAQGHLTNRPTAAQARTARLAAAHGLTYVPPANPAEADLSGVRAGENVLLRGLGLNFFDYMSLLSTGRGGRYERRNGRLVYHPSGDEPVMHGFSRRGIPYQARGENEKGPAGRYLPRLLTPEHIEELRARPGHRLDFRREVWPLVRSEVEAVYYGTLLERSGRSDERAAFEEAYLHADADAAEHLLDEHVIPPRHRLDWGRLLDPLRGRQFQDAGELRAWVLEHLDEDVRAAREGNVSGPLKAALDILRDLRNEVRLAVDHGGLEAGSHRDDLQGWYTPMNAFLSIGPPVSRIEEMGALIRARVLHLVGPGARVDIDVADHRLVARSSAVGGDPVRARVLVEARLPEADLRRTDDALLRRLLARRECRPHTLRGPAGPHETGALAVTPRPYRVIDALGRAHPRRFAYGVPTEGVHWATAAGIRPGVDSVTLGDSDAIARAVLALTAQASAAVTTSAATAEAGGAEHLALEQVPA